jgi:FG-GAP-like repeat/Lectin C-type domain/FG-GAP repeat
VVTSQLEQASASVPSPSPLNVMVPELRLNLTQTDVFIGRPAAAIAPELMINDPDGGTLPGARVFVDNYNALRDRLGIVGQTANSGNLSISDVTIAWEFDAGTGVLSLNGTADNTVYQQALRQVSYSNVSNATDETFCRIQFVLGNLLVNSENNHFYEFVANQGISWTNARDASNSRNYLGIQGYLATITSAKEQAFIQQRVQGNGWIGASDTAIEGEWRWVTGPEGQADNNKGLPFWSGRSAAANPAGKPVVDEATKQPSYSNWQTREPNNQNNNENYGHIVGNPNAYAGQNAIGKWNDLPDSGSGGDFRPLGYIVEYGGLSGDTTLNFSATVSVNIKTDKNPVTSENYLIWRNNETGENAIWQMKGSALDNSAFIMQVQDKNWKMISGGDFNGDGKNDILWRNYVTGENAIWLMNGFNKLNADGSFQKFLTHVPDTSWKMIAAADFNGDGKDDILWRNDRNGENAVWFMDANTITTDNRYKSDEQFFVDRIRFIDTNWEMVGAGDFDGDGKADIAWRKEVTGENAIWLMDGISNDKTTVTSKASGERFITTQVDKNWKIGAVDDFDGNGKSDLAWYNSISGETGVWFVDATKFNGENFLTIEQFIVDETANNVLVPGTDWRIETTGDINGDGKSDLIWRNYGDAVDSDTVAIWQMDGANSISSGRQYMTRGGNKVLTGDLNWDIVDFYVA